MGELPLDSRQTERRLAAGERRKYVDHRTLVQRCVLTSGNAVDQDRACSHHVGQSRTGRQLCTKVGNGRSLELLALKPSCPAGAGPVPDSDLRTHRCSYGFSSGATSASGETVSSLEAAAAGSASAV